MCETKLSLRREGQLQETQLTMSTFAVEKWVRSGQMRCGSGMALVMKDVDMRIVETGAAGVIALASQFLIVAAVLL